MKAIKKERKKHTLKGKGGYLGDLITHGASALGSFLGKKAEQILGVGDYTIRGKGRIEGEVPDMHAATSSLRFSHKEYLGDIASSTLFQLSQWDLNPGLTATFPFLSQIATSFEKYRFRGLAFVFKSTSAKALNSTNTAMGTVVMATKYDLSDPDFQNKQQMETAWMASSGEPSDSLLHGVEVKASMESAKVFLVRAGAVPAGHEAALYDIGQFNLATVGMQASSNIGELWVTYDVELLYPKLVNAGSGLNILSDVVRWTAGASVTANFFGNNPTQYGLLGGTLSGGTTYTFPTSATSGNWLILYAQKGSGGVPTVAPLITLTHAVAANTASNIPFGPIGNGILANEVGGTSASTFNQDPGAGSSDFVLKIMAVITLSVPAGQAASLAFSGGTLPGAPDDGYLLVMPYPAVGLAGVGPDHKHTPCLFTESDDEKIRRMAVGLRIPFGQFEAYSNFFWTYRKVMGQAPLEDDVLAWLGADSNVGCVSEFDEKEALDNPPVGVRPADDNAVWRLVSKFQGASPVPSNASSASRPSLRVTSLR